MIQWKLVTACCSMKPSIARPPPNVNAPTMTKKSASAPSPVPESSASGIATPEVSASSRASASVAATRTAPHARDAYSMIATDPATSSTVTMPTCGNAIAIADTTANASCPASLIAARPRRYTAIAKMPSTTGARP